MLSPFAYSQVFFEEAYDMKTMCASPYDDRAVVARIFAFGTSAFEVDTADAAGVVRVIWKVPFPGGDGFEGVDGDLHGFSRVCAHWRRKGMPAAAPLRVFSVVWSPFVWS